MWTAQTSVQTSRERRPSITSLPPKPFPNKAIPLEILNMIFLIAVDYRTRATQHSSRMESDTARYVSQVSRQWRQAALSSVRMWKQALDPDTNMFAWLCVVLRRCNYEPLSLVSTPRRLFSLVDMVKWRLLRKVFDQCQYVHLELTRDVDVRGVRWLLSHPAPCILEATVVWDAKDVLNGMPPDLTVWSRLLFGNSAPNLRLLRLVNCPYTPMGGDMTEPPLSFPSLRYVTFETLSGHTQSFYRPCPTRILAVLRTLSSITHLNLSHGIDDDLMGQPLNVARIARVQLLSLQSFSFKGHGAIFVGIMDRLVMPVECAKHVFIDFNPFLRWTTTTTDALISKCLALIPIAPYESIGVSIQLKRLYISFGHPALFELAFDLREYRGDDLTPPALVSQIINTNRRIEPYRPTDYFVCAVRHWIFQHPAIYGRVTTLRFGSTAQGVSTMLMLPLLCSSPNLECIHIATCGSLNNPYLIDALRQVRNGTERSHLNHLQCLIIPFCALVDMSNPSKGRDLSALKGALLTHATSSLLAAVRRIEVAVLPEVLNAYGPNVSDAVERQVSGLQRVLSPWSVSWYVVDENWLNYFFYPGARVPLARDQDFH